MASTDTAQRFLFEQTDFRGELVTLEQSYQEALAAHQYPEPIRCLLGELAASAVLLASTLKFSGIMTLQARSEGPLKLLMVECRDDKKFRALARWDQDADLADTELTHLMPGGQMLISIDPTGGVRYQGIVALESNRLADCFESYFQQSEQLPTRLWLSASSERAAGLLLQALPASVEPDAEARQSCWEHLCTLADTLKPEEQLGLDHETILTRLFHQDQVRVMEQHPVAFSCTCSRQRCEQALLTLERAELDEIIAEQGEIRMDCQFCSHPYRFTGNDLEQLFGDEKPALH